MGSIQPKYIKEKESTKIAPFSTEKKDKQIDQDNKTSIFIDAIPKQTGIEEMELYNHCFHTLLLHDKDTLQSLTDHVISSFSDPLSAVDITRVQLQLLSLCTVSDEGILAIKESMLDGIRVSSWCWSPEERSLIQMRIKNQQKRTSEEPVPPKKRSRKSKQVNEDSITELSLTIPNHTIKYTLNLLSKEIVQNMEEHERLFDELKPKLDGEVE